MPTPGRPLVRIGVVLMATALVLAGCNAAAPLTSGAATTEPSRSPAPSIDTAAGIAYANAAVAKWNKDPFVTHIEQVSTGKGEVSGQAFQMVATMSADFAGKDMAFDLEATAAGAKVAIAMRVVGKDVYVKQSGLWLKGKRSALKAELAEVIDAVRVIKDPHDLRYLGEELVGKKTLEHFTANRELPYDSGAGFKGRYDTFDLWVTKDGTPVRIAATFTASSAAVREIKGTSTMDFTKFGGTIKIKVPKNKK